MILTFVIRVLEHYIRHNRYFFLPNSFGILVNINLDGIHKSVQLLFLSIFVYCLVPLLKVDMDLEFNGASINMSGFVE